MSDLKERNFRILQDKISGLSHAKIGEAYGLSATAVAGILKAQLSKVAEFDFEFERRLGQLSEALESSEENAKRIAKVCESLEKQEDFLKTQLSIKTKELERLTYEVQALRKSSKCLTEEFNKLKRSMETTSTLKYTLEYEKVKESIEKFRN